MDTLITAISQRPDVGKLQVPAALGVSRQGTFQVDPLTLQSAIPWIFAGGDAVLGPQTVIEAIAQGKEAALSINRFLQGQDLSVDREKSFEIAEPEMTGILQEPRCRPRLRDPQVRRRDFEEVVQVLTAEEAQREAGRCLACGICSECYQCLEVCQAGAIDHALAGNG